jgi:hypothetical protein
MAISAGGAHTVALKSDGTMVAWGSNSDGQRNVPMVLSDVMAIAAGGWHTVALKSSYTFDGFLGLVNAPQSPERRGRNSFWQVLVSLRVIGGAVLDCSLVGIFY